MSFRFTSAGLILLFVTLMNFVGCQQAPPPAALDPNLAKASLERFLTTWKSGGKPEDLPKAVPPIVVGDPDWEAGQKLTNFQLVEQASRNDGTNAHLQVRLELAGRRGGRTKSAITYIVSTSPVITIQRQYQ